jgi:bifunctional DNA-binding transcriptional regulator/antitoxin component of YhaV-PrlF toxin-antitoxin module
MALIDGSTHTFGAKMITRLTIDKAGGVAIPRSLREELHLEPGDSVGGAIYDAILAHRAPMLVAKRYSPGNARHHAHSACERRGEMKAEFSRCFVSVHAVIEHDLRRSLRGGIGY